MKGEVLKRTEEVLLTIALVAGILLIALHWK